MKSNNDLKLRPSRIPTETVNDLNIAISAMMKIADAIKQDI
jgi:hypothetical protein